MLDDKTKKKYNILKLESVVDMTFSPVTTIYFYDGEIKSKKHTREDFEITGKIKSDIIEIAEQHLIESRVNKLNKINDEIKKRNNK